MKQKLYEPIGVIITIALASYIAWVMTGVRFEIVTHPFEALHAVGLRKG